MKNFYCVYVLFFYQDKKFYIGFTGNLPRRIKEHQSGKNISTAKRGYFKLIYFEGHLSKQDALRREAYFKTTKGKTTLRQILRESLIKEGK